MASQTRYYAKPNLARTFTQTLLTKAGLSNEHALLMANCLVQADSRGVVGLAHPRQILPVKLEGAIFQ